MKTYQELKKEYQANQDALADKHLIFFAFNNNQFDEGKAKIGITDNKDLVSIGAGGYMPKKEADAYFEASSRLYKEFKSTIKANKEAKEGAILYELYNHEAFYTGRLDEVIEKFDGVYTKDDIQAVYKKHYQNANL